VSTFTDGVFLAGCCQGPKDIPDTVAQAGSAAACALALLNSERVEVEPLTARVIEELCTGCGSCETTCPSGAIKISDGIAVVTAAECGGCGVCAAGCVRGAVTVANSTDEQVLANIEGILEVGHG
jgi:heterodisulfide reductase subunit A